MQREVPEVSNNTTHIDPVDLITSQCRAQAEPAKLLKLNGNHWGIENRLHPVCDRAYDEDRCRERTVNTARRLACLRNLAIDLLRLFKAANIKAAFRDWAANANRVLKMLGLSFVARNNCPSARAAASNGRLSSCAPVRRLLTAAATAHLPTQEPIYSPRSAFSHTDLDRPRWDFDRAVVICCPELGQLAARRGSGYNSLLCPFCIAGWAVFY